MAPSTRAEALADGTGMMIGVPVRGSGITSDASPNARRIVSAVMTSVGAPWAMTLPACMTTSSSRVPGGQVEIVEHRDDRRSPFAVEIAQKVEHLQLVAQIEESGRLVEQQDARILRECHRDPHALTLPARQIAYGPLCEVCDPRPRHRLVHPRRVVRAPALQQSAVG
jgi:hypothetical protein